MQAEPQALAPTVEHLTRHADFNWQNPNRFRSVLGAMTMNHAGFHEASGAAYALLADWLMRLDPVNPQTTARICSAFQTWRRYDGARQEKIGAALDRILALPQLSRDTHEMISRIRSAKA
jgi:aminopeptidase N